MGGGGGVAAAREWGVKNSRLDLGILLLFISPKPTWVDWI